MSKNKKMDVKTSSALELMNGFKDHVEVKDRTWRLKTYKACFLGSEAVSVMTTIFDISRGDAVKLGKLFMDRGLFFHVSFSHSFKDKELFYRFSETEIFPGGMSKDSKKFDLTEAVVHDDNVDWSQMESELNVAPLDKYNKTLVSHVHPLNWTNPDVKESDIYNLVVIGGGTGGLVTGAGSAGLGAKVALIETHLLGGDCLNVGCVPSKALIRAAHAIRDVKESARFGVEIKGGYTVNFGKIMERMRKLRAGISHHDSAQRFKSLGVDVFFGKGKFTAKDIIQVGNKTLTFRRAVIATGGRPRIPNIRGLDSVPYLTNHTIFNLTKLPKRLGVIGSGPIGSEMAQSFALFGSKVSIFGRSDHILGKEDADAIKIVQNQFVKDGVIMKLQVKYKEITYNKEKKIITIIVENAEKKEEKIEVDQLLVSAGRDPNVEGIGLKIAGINFNKKGVIVNDLFQTTNKSVYAVGDCCYKYKFTHASDFTARTVIRNALFFGFAKGSDLLVPWGTYTFPEVAHVGIYPREAKKMGIKITTFKKNFDEIDRAILDGETEGFVKIHVKEGTDKILGCTIVASHAGDMISQVTTLMQTNVGLTTLSRVIFPYPTQAEAIRKIGDDFNRTKLTPTAKTALTTLLNFRKTIF